MKYIKQIDGLRAVAIILLVFYHLKFLIFNDRYIGVDIFFVISGFLITSIILSEINNNNFSILDFFSRRIRRISPILFFVLFVSSFFSFFLLKPKIFVLFIYSSLSSLFFSNFFFLQKQVISMNYHMTIHFFILGVFLYMNNSIFFSLS